MTREQKVASNRARRLANPAHYNALTRATNKRMKDRAYNKLGNRCANPNCKWLNEDGTVGCTDRRCLQVDHVNDDGEEERRRLGINGGGYTLYKIVVEDTEGRYQLLCANCNWIKRGDAL